MPKPRFAIAFQDGRKNYSDALIEELLVKLRESPQVISFHNACMVLRAPDIYYFFHFHNSKDYLVLVFKIYEEHINVNVRQIKSPEDIPPMVSDDVSVPPDVLKRISKNG